MLTFNGRHRMTPSSPLHVFNAVRPLAIKPQHEKLVAQSFASRLFTEMSHEDLCCLFMSPFYYGKSYDVWVKRASHMVSAVLQVLVQLRDDHGVSINYVNLPDYFIYQRLVNLVQDPRLSSESFEALDGYLFHLPGPRGSQRSEEAHGFLIMQFSEWLRELRGYAIADFIQAMKQHHSEKTEVGKILIDNESKGVIPFPILAKILIELGFSSDEFIHSTNSAQRRQMIEMELNI